MKLAIVIFVISLNALACEHAEGPFLKGLLIHLSTPKRKVASENKNEKFAKHFNSYNKWKQSVERSNESKNESGNDHKSKENK